MTENKTEQAPKKKFTIQELGQGLNNWLEAKGLSQRTITEYNNYFHKLDLNKLFSNPQYPLKFLQQHKNNPVARAFLNNLLTYLKKGPEIPSAHKYYIKKLDFEIPKKTGRRKVRLPDTLTEDEVLLIARKTTNMRDNLMVLITFYGGLRECELIGDIYGLEGIKPYDFNWRTWVNNPEKPGKLRVIGKGNKQRVVFIPPKVMSSLFKWIRQIAHLKKNKKEKLFKMGDRRWRYILSKASFVAVGRHINPHLLRHSCATWLLDDMGFNVTEVKEYLGHSNLSTTSIYLHVSNKKLKDKFSSKF